MFPLNVENAFKNMLFRHIPLREQLFVAVISEHADKNKGQNVVVEILLVTYTGIRLIERTQTIVDKR